MLVPYLGVFLDGRGFSSEEIGELFALITFARILGPNLWATLADKTGKGLRVIQLGTFLTFSTFCLIFFVDSFWGITLSFALMMMFWTAVLPQLEVITLTSVDSNANRYSKIRLWGSVGFILLTVVTGKSIDMFNSEAPIYVSAFILFGLFVVSLFLSEPKIPEDKNQSDASIWQQVKTVTFVCFIISALLLQVSFGPFYGFFALYLRDLGYDGQQTGGLIALGVAAEVIIFLLAGRFIAFFGVKWILIISTVLTAMRWLILAIYPQFTFMVIASQILHAFSFGMTHAASMYFIHHYFSTKYQSTGQALYVSIAFGFGGAIGNYSAGQLWMQGEGANVSFLFATFAAVISALLLLFVAKDKMQGTNEPAVDDKELRT